MPHQPRMNQPADPYERLTYPRTVTEYGAERVIRDVAEYREHLALRRHEIDFRLDELREQQKDS